MQRARWQNIYIRATNMSYRKVTIGPSTTAGDQLASYLGGGPTSCFLTITGTATASVYTGNSNIINFVHFGTNLHGGNNTTLASQTSSAAAYELAPAETGLLVVEAYTSGEVQADFFVKQTSL